MSTLMYVNLHCRECGYSEPKRLDEKGPVTIGTSGPPDWGVERCPKCDNAMVISLEDGLRLMDRRS